MALMDDVDAGARWAPAFRALGDERLARMVEGGNDTAFSAIYGRYAPVLHGYCRSLLHDEEEAGDALQNAMLKALQAMRRAARTGPLRPWLFRIAHNESVTIIRQRSRRPGELTDNVVAGQADAFRHAAAREELARLLRDLGDLTDYQRSALVMRELGGLGYDEIATALDTTPLAARQAVFTAKRKLDPEGAFSARKRLKLLLPPAPAGFALFGLLGGGGVAVSTGGKALIGAVAAVSIGIGGVEIAEHVLAPEPEKRTAVAATSQKRAKRNAKPVSTPAPTPTVTPKAARPASPAPTATPEPAATVSFEASERANSRSTERQGVSEPTPTPEPESTPEPAAQQPRPDRPRRGHHPAAPESGETFVSAPEPVSQQAGPHPDGHLAAADDDRFDGDRHHPHGMLGPGPENVDTASGTAPSDGLVQ